MIAAYLAISTVSYVTVIAFRAIAALSLSLSLSLSLHFNGHFPAEPGLAVFIEAKDDGSGGENLSYMSCKAPVKSSPPTNQHPVFFQAGCPYCRPTNSVKAPKGKISHSMDLLTPSLPGVFQLCL